MNQILRKPCYEKCLFLEVITLFDIKGVEGMSVPRKPIH